MLQISHGWLCHQFSFALLPHTVDPTSHVTFGPILTAKVSEVQNNIQRTLLHAVFLVFTDLSFHCFLLSLMTYTHVSSVAFQLSLHPYLFLAICDDLLFVWAMPGCLNGCVYDEKLIHFVSIVTDSLRPGTNGPADAEDGHPASLIHPAQLPTIITLHFIYPLSAKTNH